MSDGSIAIVGASCRFPGAANLNEFWQLLAAGGDAVSEVDSRRWSTRFFFHPDRGRSGRSYTWSAGLIADVDLFEPGFFGISPREAVQMDPQQRVLLELVWHAIEDAGISAASLSGSETGVYIGASSTDYSDLRLGDPAGGDAYFMTGNTLSILANRVSYVFDLRGPSLTIDTACSSSLVALHHACEAIRAGRVSSAVVGGINLLLAPYPFLGFCNASMLSRRGRCFAFDERADGYVRGEGGGVAILKPLAAALADGNPIRAVILASGVNSDGRTIGLSLPSETAQAALLHEVYARAGITADSLAFFEMHGTGTPAGDPIEAAAVGNSLGKMRSMPLPIGSVKTNIGHLEPASGMAGLLKAALALEHGIVPPSLHCEVPNPQIAFESLNLHLVREAEPIAGNGGARHAGINAFGFGGTNAHVVLGGWPERPAEPSSAPLPPLVISARSEAALRELAGTWGRVLAEVPSTRLPGMLRAAARGRDHHAHRLAAAGGDPAAIARMLADFVEGRTAKSIATGTAVVEGRLAFVFSGNGAQFAGMGREAMRANAAFRAAVGEADAVLHAQLGWSPAELIEQGVDQDGVARADVAQPLLFAIQVGIVGALRAEGVVASGFLGHSVGEIAASWAAGALSLADAARVVVWRSRNQQRTRGTGRMAALALAPDAAEDLLAELDSPAEIAALNGSRSLTISAPCGEIERLEGEAHRRGLWFRPLDLDFAFHSRQMDPIREDLLANLSDLGSQTPVARLVSTVTGGIVDGELLGAEHWWRNIRQPVRFAEAAERLVGEGYRIFVEIGPHAVLQSYLRDALRSAEVEGRVLASLVRRGGGGDPFPGIAARCHVAGYDLTTAAIFDGPADPRGLPLYPWQRQRYWFDETVEAVNLTNPSFDHPLLGFRQSDPVPCWVNDLDEQLLPWIADHAVEGVPVLPAAAILETALATARSQWPDAPVLEIFDVEVRRPLPFDNGRTRSLRTTIRSDDGDWELASRPRLSQEPMTVHAVARLSAATDPRPTLDWGQDSPEPSRIDGDTLYHLAKEAGLDYGPRFRTVEHIDADIGDHAVVLLDPAPIGEPLDAYLLHPALLDGALQGLIGLLARDRHAIPGIAFLPWRFGRVRLVAPFGRAPRRARLRLTRAGTRSVASDVALFDEAGELVGEISECLLRRVELVRRGGPEERALRVDLVPMPVAEADPPQILGQVGAILSRLAAAPADARQRDEEAPLLEALAAAIGYRALRRLVEAGEPFTLGGLIEDGRLAAASRGSCEHLLRSLEVLGAAAETAGHWRLAEDSELPEAAQIWRLLLAEAPDLVAELGLTAACVESLPRGLADGPVEPDGRLSPMVEHLLLASPASAAGIDLLCDAVATVARSWPDDRRLRILEIGARSRGATRRLLGRLARSGAPFTYVAANPDPEQTAELSFLAERFVGAVARQWSPGDPIEQLEESRFDMVLAAGCCARLRLDQAAFADLGDLLAPGGVLLAFEPEPNLLWEVVVGDATGWWRPGEDVPLRSAEEWRAELAAAGFQNSGAERVATAPWPSGIFWGSAPVQATVAAPAVEAKAVTVVGGDAFAAELKTRLSAAGHRVRIAPFAGDDADAQPGGIVLFVAVADPRTGSVSAARQMAELARLAAESAERQNPLWLVTCDAQQISPGDHESAAIGGALWGLARVLVNEMPRLSVRQIDLASAVPLPERARQIALEVAAGSGESEVVWSPQGRRVLRLRQGLPARWEPFSDSLGLTAGQPGALDSLGWERRPTRPVGPGEVEIEVRAAGLNFRDVMWALGLLPEEALIDGFAGADFGLECAGVIRSVGVGVEGLAVGDRVMAFAPAAFSSRVVTIAEAVTPIPPGTGFAAAATIPVAFVTAIYALRHLAQLQAGEHVLIHAAAGGVGLAAIQYAKHCGAIVTATAGSDIKRAFLRLAGADYVLDSRNLDFADSVREITQGRGVDVVLNSLSGEAMERSIGVLRPFGRFLELGKRDFYLNRRLHLRPLRHNVSYFAIDIDQLPLRRPDLARALLAEIAAALADGTIRPLAHRVFSFAEVDEAFRLMQSSGHIGKLVLVPGEPAEVPLRRAPELVLRRDGTYLVSGGIDGFGYEAARWLAERGAGSIALVGRRGADTPGCAARITALEAAGAEVRLYRGDIADRDALSEILATIRADQPPLRGIVHAASAIDDGLAADLDAVRAAAILRPKLDGALALDALTRDDPLELFVLFSSATTLLGAPGQGVYVAANMALEALARQRRAAGRPALAIAWGPIADAGYLAERPETRDMLARRLGAKPINAAQALAGLPALISAGLPVAAFAETSWSDARRFLPILGSPLFSDVRAKAQLSPSDEPLGERLARLEPEAALTLLTSVVAEEAAMILRLPASGLDPSRPLSQMGMDSLMAVELRLALEDRLRIDLPLMSLAEGTSVASIAARLAGAIPARRQDAEVVALAARYEAAEPAEDKFPAEAANSVAAE